MKKLVLCADDFALHEAASCGIAALGEAGRISATSVMVLSPRWADDVRLLQSLRGRIDIGLHLDWTSGFAIEAGHGRTLGSAMLAASLGRLRPAHLRALIESQLDAFEQHWKAPPDHIDGHQHVQQFAGIREAVVAAVAGRYGASAGRRSTPAPYLRISQVSQTQSDLKSRVIAAMGAQTLARQAQSAGIPCAPALSGVYDFRNQPPDYAARMSVWLRDSPEGCIVMCHPANGVAPDDAIGATRLREYQYLMSENFALELSRSGVQLSRGGPLYSAMPV